MTPRRLWSRSLFAPRSRRERGVGENGKCCSHIGPSTRPPRERGQGVRAVHDTTNHCNARQRPGLSGHSMLCPYGDRPGVVSGPAFTADAIGGLSCPLVPARERGVGENGKLHFSDSIPSPASGEGAGGEGRARRNRPLQRSSTTRPQRAQHAVPLRGPAGRRLRPGVPSGHDRPSFLPPRSRREGGVGENGKLSHSKSSFPLARASGGGGQGVRVDASARAVLAWVNRSLP